ncbi:hypothetical protein HMPREF3232_00210 [Fannyhessea vaginae]|nr:hypothetical protein HMPREF3232_00210 [Fannyhessea vaginae]
MPFPFSFRVLQFNQKVQKAAAPKPCRSVPRIAAATITTNGSYGWVDEKKYRY